MQTLFLFILFVYLAVEAAEHALHLLNLRHLARHGAEVPPGFASHVNGTTLEKMHDYTLANGRLQRLESLVTAAVILLFLFGGLLNRFNNFIALQGWPPAAAGVVFFLILIYADTLIKLPFSLFHTFGLEKKFGFSTMTPGLFIRDTVKSLLLGSLLLGLLLYVLLWLVLALPTM